MNVLVFNNNINFVIYLIVVNVKETNIFKIQTFRFIMLKYNSDIYFSFANINRNNYDEKKKIYFSCRKIVLSFYFFFLPKARRIFEFEIL